MTNNRENSAGDRLFDLADKVFDDAARADDVARLESLLKNDPASRRDYLRYAFVHGQLAITTPALPQPASVEEYASTGSAQLKAIAANRKPFRQRVLIAGGMALAAAILLAVSLWRPASDSTPPLHGNRFVAMHYDNRDLPIHTVAVLGSSAGWQKAESSNARAMSPTTLNVQHGETQFSSASGADVHIEGPALFGVNAAAGGVLYNGSVRARLESAEASFSVLTSNLRIVDLGTEFRVTVLDDRHVRVHVLDGEVEVQSRVRLPRFYWNFDTPITSASGRRVPDKIDGLSLALGAAARPIKGIIGDGALAFDNTSNAFARVEGGVGEKVGAGSMACSSGITLEAMFISRWTAGAGNGKAGNTRDYDEFFRKEDGNCRILLSFQNDGDANRFDLPDVPPGPCLSFGLFLKGLGYSELDMPLDGRHGRPTLAELTNGQPHHVVATYDSFSGRKAIFIDGKLCFSHAFPVGTLILSGGPAPAEIGNTREIEPFNGVIDEFTFYDFALTPEEIAMHHRHAASGKTYFGELTEQLHAVRWRAVTRIGEGQTRLFNQHTGLPIDAPPGGG